MEPLVQAFLIPNKKVTLYATIFQHRESVEKISTLTGIKFLPGLKLKYTWDLDSNNAFRCNLIRCHQFFLSKPQYDKHMAIHKKEDFICK